MPMTYEFTVAETEMAFLFEPEVAINVTGGHEYEGSYEVTPTDETQILPMAGMLAREDIVVNPIPSNYGRISWDGRVITVS